MRKHIARIYKRFTFNRENWNQVDLIYYHIKLKNICRAMHNIADKSDLTPFKFSRDSCVYTWDRDSICRHGTYCWPC